MGSFLGGKFEGVASPPLLRCMGQKYMQGHDKKSQLLRRVDTREDMTNEKESTVHDKVPYNGGLSINP